MAIASSTASTTWPTVTVPLSINQPANSVADSSGAGKPSHHYLLHVRHAVATPAVPARHPARRRCSPAVEQLLARRHRHSCAIGPPPIVTAIMPATSSASAPRSGADAWPAADLHRIRRTRLPEHRRPGARQRDDDAQTRQQDDGPHRRSERHRRGWPSATSPCRGTRPNGGRPATATAKMKYSIPRPATEARGAGTKSSSASPRDAAIASVSRNSPAVTTRAVNEIEQARGDGVRRSPDRPPAAACRRRTAPGRRPSAACATPPARQMLPERGSPARAAAARAAATNANCAGVSAEHQRGYTRNAVDTDLGHDDEQRRHRRSRCTVGVGQPEVQRQQSRP